MPLSSTLEGFLHRKVTVLHRDRPLHEAARAMREKAIGMVLVGDHQGNIIGVVTDRDLSCRGFGERLSAETPIEKIMTPQPAFLECEATLEQAIRLMEENGIRRVPVLQQQASGRHYAIGLVTLDDLIAAEMIDSFHLARIVRAQVRRRTGEFAHQRGTLGAAVDAQGRVVSDAEWAAKYSREVAMRSGLGAHGLSDAQIHSVLNELLEALVSRLHYSAARHLLAQLPPAWVDRLEEFAHGPDRRSSLARLLACVSERGEIGKLDVRRAVAAVARGWASLIPEHELLVLRAQLPPEFSELLPSIEDDERRRWAHAAA